MSAPIVSRSHPRHARATRRHRATDAAFAGALAAGLLTVALLFGALFFWSDRVDAANRDHEVRLTENGIISQTRELEDSLTPITQWDDSIVHLDARFDPAWARSNVGVFLDQSLDMDRAILLDASDAPIFAMKRARQLPANALPPILSAAQPLVRAVRQREAARGLLTTPGDGSHMVSTPIHVSTAAVLDGKPFLLTATLIQPDFGTALPTGPRSPIVISAVDYDAVFRRLSKNYQLQRPRLAVGSPGIGPHEARASIVGDDGRPVATVVWSPQRPGRDLLRSALPVVTIATLALAGGLLSLMGFLRANLRSLRKVMVELVEARDSAEAANDAKSKFLATMSHEIRTPLNGILGMAQIMQTGELGVEQNDRVEVIKGSGQTLLAILNNLLDLSKIEAESLELEIAQFSLEALTNGACAAFAAMAEAKGLSFTLTLSDDARGLWRGDPLRLQQILYNLISNAVKFTDRGEVRVTISAPQREGAKWLAVSVSDTGLGIAAETLPTVFDRFVQADNAPTRRFGGTGLGLAITQELAELMGGTASAQSTPGAGSEFLIELPLAWDGPEPSAPETAALSTEREIGALRILAAEDNSTNQLVLRAILQSFGLTPTMVENGRQAVEGWRLGNYDLVLMDIQMPEMDGIAAVREIRTLEARTGGHTPIIAVTANAMKHQVDEYWAAGFDGYLAKPIDIGELLRIIQAVAADASHDLATLALPESRMA
jgi:signal transduction histidine kinase/ActR/RegA family two-component response regulator